MKKIFAFIAVAILSVGAATAQTTEEGWSYAAELGIGSQLEIGGRAQYGINEYVAIDVPVVKYNFDYGKVNHHELKLMAGARGYSPEFGPGLKGIAALDLGYGAIMGNGYSSSCFAMDLTLGIQINKNLYAGYGFGLMSNKGSHSDHVVRVGWNF